MTTVEPNERARQLLRTTAPVTTNVDVLFPEEYSNGRVIVQPGSRMIDWEAGEWVPYEREGVGWYRDTLRDEDFMALRRALSRQL